MHAPHNPNSTSWWSVAPRVSALAHSSRPALTRARPFSSLASLAAAALAAVFACASAAWADAANHTFKWLPSPSQGVEGYILTLRSADGAETVQHALGLPAEVGGRMSAVVEIEDSVTWIASLQAWGSGLVSVPSNQITLEAVPRPRVTSVRGFGTVADGAIKVTARVEGAVESVTFAIDGALYRIENAAPWSLAGDGGGPATIQPFNTALLSDGMHSYEVVAWSENGATGVASPPMTGTFEVANAQVLPDPEPDSGPGALPGLPPVAQATPESQVVGLYAVSDSLRLLRLNGRSELLVRDDLIRNYGARPTWCDLDDDGDRDLVVGFGRGSGSRLLLLTLEDLAVVDREVIVGTDPDYAASNGETIPACGDVDGDGLNEIAVGLGASAWASIMMLDDQGANYATMSGTSGPRISTLSLSSRLGVFYYSFGSTKPSLADVDGDGRDEILIGRTEEGQGTITVLDDALELYQPIRPSGTFEDLVNVVPLYATLDYDGATDVAGGDVDADGRAEIVVASHRSGRTVIDVYDDAQAGFGRLVVNESAAIPGLELEVLAPMLADLNGDGRLEVAVGGSTAPSLEGKVQVFDDIESGFAPYVWTGKIDGSVAAPAGVDRVWPALLANP